MRNSPFKKTFLASVIFATSTAAHAGALAVVTNGADNGAGSLRDAIENQKAKTVFISPDVSIIQLDTTLNYDGTRALRILGTGQTLKLDKNETLLSVNQGADLFLADLRLEGKPGYFSIENRGDLNGESAGKGIFVDVRADQTGTVKLSLKDVEVTGFANHGVHVSDCSLADDCGAGAGGGGEGSPASISIRMINSSISDVGNGKFDADGLRVDDRGAGDISFYARNARFENVGADGVELDEGDAGSIYTDIISTTFEGNGNYCNPAVLDAYLPGNPEGEFEKGQVTEEQIPPVVTGTLDDTCFERSVDYYDDGSVKEYEIALDLDDGIDLDEAGDGSIFSLMLKSVITRNMDEGVDYDEAGEGHIDVAFIRNRGIENNDDAYKLSEEDGGNLNVLVVKSDALDNGGEGFTFEEEGDGNLDATVVKAHTLGNKKSNKDGLEVVQEDQGVGVLRLIQSDIQDGIKLEGVELN